MFAEYRTAARGMVAGEWSAELVAHTGGMQTYQQANRLTIGVHTDTSLQNNARISIILIAKAATHQMVRRVLAETANFEPSTSSESLSHDWPCVFKIDNLSESSGACLLFSTSSTFRRV